MDQIQLNQQNGYNDMMRNSTPLYSSPNKVKIIKYRRITWERPVVCDEITKH